MPGGALIGCGGGGLGPDRVSGVVVAVHLPVGADERGLVLPAVPRPEQVVVALVADGLGFGGPDRVQDGEVVGVGQVVLPDRGGG